MKKMFTSKNPFFYLFIFCSLALASADAQSRMQSQHNTALVPVGMNGSAFGGGSFSDIGFNLPSSFFGPNSTLGYIGSWFSPSSFLGGSFTRVKYCVISSKISYPCVLPNVKFFIYTHLVSFPSLPFLGFVGPTLSTINILYLILNYLPYALRDSVCIVKAVVFGGILPTPSVPLPSLPWSLPIPKMPLLAYLNSTLADEITHDNTPLIENYIDLNRIF